MQWVLDNIQIIIVVAAVIASWLGNLKKNQGGGTPPESPFTDDSEQSSPMEADDLTRRIQEQIRRKIAERQAEAQSVPAATPPPLETAWDARQREIREELARSAQQESMPPELPTVEETRAELPEMPSAVPVIPIPAMAINHQATPADAAEPRLAGLRLALRDKTALRRAIILREVLDRPLALR